MSTGLVHLHNVLRWVVLLVAFGVLASSLHGVLAARAREKRDRILGLVFTISMDVQLLLGVALLAVGPTFQAASQDWAVTMKDPGLRKIAVEHPTLMILAVVVAHVTSVLVKRASDDSTAHKRALAGYGLALLTILAGIPWFRPLFPGM